MHDNAERSRFELDVDGQVVFADYQRRDGLLVILYVYAPPPLRGTGASDRLMKAVGADAKAKGLKVVPICGYAAAWLKRSHDYRDLLA